MKFVLYFAIGWCVVCGFAGEALAYDGNGLLEDCQIAMKVLGGNPIMGDQFKAGAASGMCLGLVQGVVGMGYLWQDTGAHYYCLPEEEFSTKQAVRVILKYLEDNPAELHRRALVLLVRAFMDAFPCEEGN